MLIHSNRLDHPTPTGYSHLAFLSTSASSWKSDSGDRLPRLEENFCQGYMCCGQNLGDLHTLLEHFEEEHAVVGSPATSTLAHLQGSSARPVLSARALQMAELTRRKAAAASTSATPTSESVSASASLEPNALQAITGNQPGKSLDASLRENAPAPFSMDVDDVDMDLGGDEMDDAEDRAATATPAQSAFDTSVLMPTSNRRSANQHRFGNRNTLSRGVDSPSLKTSPQQSNQTPSGVSNMFAARRSLSPAHSASSPEEGSGPNTPTAEDDESDFDPSASSTSIAAQFASRQPMFAPLGCVTPSMLLPAQYTTPSPPENDPADSLQQLRIKVPPPKVSLNQSVNANPDSPAIIMGDDPSVTTLSVQDLGAGQQAFVAPPPTLPSGRAWTAPAAKPYKCPVPGCDKSYKQQNGLKYHRLHGNCNNRLRESSTATEESDGRETFEDKPYGCYVGAGCGKRYKK